MSRSLGRPCDTSCVHRTDRDDCSSVLCSDKADVHLSQRGLKCNFAFLLFFLSYFSCDFVCPLMENMPDFMSSLILTVNKPLLFLLLLLSVWWGTAGRTWRCFIDLQREILRQPYSRGQRSELYLYWKQRQE